MLEHISQWSMRAKCRGKYRELDKILFAESIANIQSGKKYCTDCPVKDLCSTYALVHDEKIGIWGGMSPKQRKEVPEYVVYVMRLMYRRDGILEDRAQSLVHPVEQSSVEICNASPDTEFPMAC